jgi:hypothetical protein
MQNIVLITRDNGEQVTGVSVFLCNRYEEAGLFCQFVNRLSLEGGENILARRVKMGKGYSLERKTPFTFDDIVTFDNRKLQMALREIDAETLALALIDLGEAVRHKFFINMSKRASMMLQEDIKCMGMSTVDKSELETAKQEVLAICLSARMMENASGSVGKTIGEYASEKEEETEPLLLRNVIRDYDKENTHAVLVFSGTGEIANTVSVALFDTPKSVDNFCDFINALKAAPGSFIYAQRAEQMVEYQITRPLITRFARILDYPDWIVSAALARVGVATVVSAVKGLDGYLREKIIENLPEFMEERVLEELQAYKQYSKKSRYAASGMESVRHARRKIVDAVIAIGRKEGKNTAEIVRG